MQYPSFRFENRLWKQGYDFIAGVDEAGRGPLAGPVVAAAVILPSGFSLATLRDSKLLSPAKRLDCYYFIRKYALAVSAAVVSHKVIDKINVLRASLLAMQRAILKLPIKPQYLLIDGQDEVEVSLPQQAIIKGDARVFSIAAAAVVAKVIRDNLMFDFHKQYPQYGFAKHKGYGTREHFKSLKRHGPSPIHRKSFAPLAKS